MTDKQPQLKCIVCGKNVEYLDEAPKGSENLSDAVSGVILGGFGSDYDKAKLVIAIHDSCIAKAIKQGFIVHQGYASFSKVFLGGCPFACRDHKGSNS